MSLNAYEVLASNFPALMLKLDANFSVSGMLQAFFTFVAHISADETLNVSGLRVQSQIVDDKARPDGYREAKIQVDFARDETVSPRITVDKRVLGERNYVIVRVLTVNAHIRNFARDIVVEIEQWAAMHKIPWEEIRCGQQVIVRRGGRRLEIDLGQKQWLKDEESDLLPASRSN